MATFKDKEGNDVEAMTTEEVETAKQEAIDAYKEQNPGDETLKTSLEEKETLLKEKEEELEKERGKEKNFAKLRKIAEEKGIKIDEKDEAFDNFKEETKKEMNELRNEVAGGKRTEAINKLSDDPEERKKIKFHLDRLSTSEDDQEAFESNLKDAYFLTTKQEVQVPNYISSAGAGTGKAKSETSTDEKEIGDKLGISEEDRKKYSN